MKSRLNLAALLLPLAGILSCMRSPNVDPSKMACKTEDNCLPGYSCIAGVCQQGGGQDADSFDGTQNARLLDSGTVDVGSTADKLETSAIDGTDVGMVEASDGPALVVPLDGPASTMDLGAFDSVRSASDLGLPDTVAGNGDLGGAQDASGLDAGIDGPATSTGGAGGISGTGGSGAGGVFGVGGVPGSGGGVPLDAPLATGGVTSSGGVSENGGSATGGVPSTGGTTSSPASLSPSVTSLSFGTVLEGASSGPYSFTVTNVGQQASGTITVTSSNPEFAQQTAVSGGCISGTTSLSSNASCIVRLVFSPVTAGERSGTISVESTSGASTAVAVAGTGCAANACGGCGTLAAAPGTYCGSCKTYTCSADKTTVKCSGTDQVVTKIALGYRYTCAVMSSGGLRCWGDNSYGQLGDGGTETTRALPGDVTLPSGTPLTGVKAVAASAETTCALLDGGIVKCWGRNNGGQVGDGTTVGRLYPTDVLTSPGGNALAGATAIVGASDSGGHSCSLHRGGGVKCWGLNSTGQLGDGTTINRTTPVDVLTSAGGEPLSGATGVTAGSNHTCALINGGLMCWGSNSNGRIGDGTTVQRPYPTSVTYGTAAPPEIVAASVGNAHSCSVMGGGGIECWGSNFLGGLGDGTLVDHSLPAYVKTSSGGGLSGVVGVSCGREQTCAIMSGGGLKCWGASPIGDGASTYRTSPVDVLTSVSTPITNVAAVDHGTNHVCALSSNGIVACWGNNDVGQIGDGVSGTHAYATNVNVCP
jgi:alpha-tubulin suppressor-like RCC1 family protein